MFPVERPPTALGFPGVGSDADRPPETEPDMTRETNFPRPDAGFELARPTLPTSDGSGFRDSEPRRDSHELGPERGDAS